jgi:DNA-binding response OmpR family regulator
MKLDTAHEGRKIEVERGGAVKAAKKRALVVDDEPGVSALLQEVLGSVDIEAEALGQREQIGRRIKEEKFDVVLIGLCGPGGEGVEIARMIRESGLNRMTPIIMISADQSPSALSRGFQSGATFFAYKPLDRAHLLGLIRVSQGAIEHERRRFRRVPVQVKVRIKSTHAEVLGETVDVSLNGAMVKVPQTIPVGTLVEVSLYLLAGAQPIVGLGTIVRIVDADHMGVLIDRLSHMELARLQDCLLPRIDGSNPEKKTV